MDIDEVLHLMDDMFLKYFHICTAVYHFRRVCGVDDTSQLIPRAVLEEFIGTHDKICEGIKELNINSSEFAYVIDRYSDFVAKVNDEVGVYILRSVK